MSYEDGALLDLFSLSTTIIRKATNTMITAIERQEINLINKGTSFLETSEGQLSFHDAYDAYCVRGVPAIWISKRTTPQLVYRGVVVYISKKEDVYI